MSENMHTAGELKQYQSLPLSVKIRMTQDRIKGWYEAWDGNVYVSVSGGKDSQVLAHIVKGMYPDVPLVFVNTGLEFDSVRLKGTEMADVVLRPEMSFVEVIKKYGYPVVSKKISHDIAQIKRNPETSAYLKYYDGSLKGKSLYDGSKYNFLIEAPFKISDQCCDVMKKKPMKKHEKQTQCHPILGVMAAESVMRKTKWLQYGCNAFETKHPTSQPLSFWTEQDILHYIKLNELNIAEIYGDIVYTDDDGMEYDDIIFNNYMPLKTTGAKRTGCVFCLFGITQDTERLLQLKEVEPLKYDYVMRGGAFDEEGMWVPAPDENGRMGLGYKFVIDWLNEHGNLNIKY